MKKLIQQKVELTYLGNSTLENLPSHMLEKCCTWYVYLPAHKMSIVTILSEPSHTYTLECSETGRKIFKEHKFLLAGGYPRTSEITKREEITNFEDTYGVSGTCSNKHGTPIKLLDFLKLHFIGVNPLDPFPITWHPGMKWFTDFDKIPGAFLNPPYATRPSPVTSYCSADTAAKLVLDRSPSIVLYKQGPEDAITALSALSWVATVKVQEPMAYTKPDGSLHPRPAPFKSMLLFLGFKKRTITLATWDDFYKGKWTSQLTSVTRNTVLRVRSSATTILRQAQNRFTAETMKLHKQILTPDEQKKLLPPEMKPLFDAPTFPPVDLSRYHSELHPDLFGKKLPSKVRSTPFRRMNIRQKNDRLVALQKHAGLHKKKHQWCESTNQGKGCLGWGHHWQCCPNTPAHRISEYTPSQKALVDFLRAQTRQSLDIHKSPTLVNLQKTTKICLQREKDFWKKFKQVSGFKKSSVDFKKQMFGQVQQRLGFWFATGVHIEVLVQMVRGIRFHEHETPDRTFTRSDWKEPDKIKWLQEWKEESLRKGTILPLPSWRAQAIENIFLVGWGDEYIKTRLIYDARLVNEYKVQKKFKLPLISDVLSLFDSSGLVIGADCSSAFSQIPLSPEEMILSTFAIPRTPGDLEPEIFCYTGPAFGCSQVPRIFQRIMGSIRDVFVQLGIPSLVYIDDLQSQICLDSDPEAMQKSKWYFDFLTNFGLIFNKKSLRVPSKVFKYLGHNVDLTTQEVYPTPERIEKIFRLLYEAITKPKISHKTLERLIGSINSIANCYFTSFVVKQLSSTLQTNSQQEAQDQKSFSLGEGIKELLLQWLQTLETLDMSQATFAKTLHQSSICVDTALSIVSDAGEAETGGFVIQEGIRARTTGLCPEDVKDYAVFDLPKKRLQSSFNRELFGIWKNLDHISTKDFFTKAQAVRVYCDNKGVIFSLINGKANIPKTLATLPTAQETTLDPQKELNIEDANLMIRKIHALLRKNNKEVQFVWRRRDHRYLRVADALSKQYLNKNPLLPDFLNRFPDPEQLHITGLHKTFRVQPNTSNLNDFIVDNKVNLLVLPHQCELLCCWLKFLAKLSRTQPKAKWYVIVPPIWSTPGIRNFLKEFGKYEMPVKKILTRERFLVKKQAWICSNI